MMTFDADTRTRLVADVTLDVDPASATIEVAVDGTWYPASWQAAAVEKGGEWTRTAQTDGYFAGPEVAAPGDAVVLKAGRHVTRTRVTVGGDVLAADSTTIVVS